MLKEIERRLAERKKEIDMQKKDVETIRETGNTGLASPNRVPGSKVVAVDVDPEMYQQLQDLAQRRKVRGVRAALLLAAKAGLRHL